MCLSEQSGPIPAAVHCGCVFVFAFSSRKWTSVQDCLVSVCHWEARWISVARGAGRVSAAPGACPGSAGFNQQHHLPLLRVIGAQWAPSATLPSTSAPPTPLRTAWCSMYLHWLYCTRGSEKIHMFSHTRSFTRSLAQTDTHLTACWNVSSY